MIHPSRVDQASFDARRYLPSWAARALGLEGHDSFSRLHKTAQTRLPHKPEFQRLPDSAITVMATTDAQTGAFTRPGDPRLLAILEEAASRALGKRPYDEQLVACLALAEGHAVEMDTGEGKTLVGALAAAALAMTGRSVHVLSINDYLARRDAEWMAPLFEMLGIPVGWIGQSLSPEQRRASYQRRVVYAPVSEVGYDVLRDRQVLSSAQKVAPFFDFAIVDEADAVMVDEATSPLVLAGTSPEPTDNPAAANDMVLDLVHGKHYTIDEDQSTVSLTDAGLDLLEERLGGINLYTSEHSAMLTRLNLALHAHTLVRRDVDYLVADEGIRLVNASRGRIAQQQRWPDGLHAAVEAKEGLAVTPPGVVLDTITVQDMLLKYRSLAGMSGTILAVANELSEFYQLRSGRVERHQPSIREDLPLQTYASVNEKMRAVVDEIIRRHRSGQPVLVGTQSVAESEELADSLPPELAARVLNARNDADEAAIVARAGEYGAVTISTQMSGRGTDIRLGGPDESDRARVVSSGGLAVLATSLYPSRRLDAQLRGRAGRQGDPGTSLAFASLEDDLVQVNSTRRYLDKIARRGATLDGTVRQRIVAQAQEIAESVRLGQHRSTWEYSRAIAAQREKVLSRREDILQGILPVEFSESPISDSLRALEETADVARVLTAARLITLYYLDEHWQGHLSLLSEIRDGIYLRVLAGQNPVDEFHRIALREFHGFFEAVDVEVADALQRLRPGQLDDPLGDLGLRRPSSTWTYMIRDNPFGSASGRAIASIRRKLHLSRATVG